uniref:Uncharacterized protein n=1 Tax=Polytomella parva TaxID=51329 RepID=A0A6U0TKE8_9CHLO
MNESLALQVLMPLPEKYFGFIFITMLFFLMTLNNNCFLIYFNYNDNKAFSPGLFLYAVVLFNNQLISYDTSSHILDHLEENELLLFQLVANIYVSIDAIVDKLV